MLRWRLPLGALLIAGIVAICWADYRATYPGVYLLPLAIVVSVLASGELIWLFGQRGLRPPRTIIYLGNLWIVAGFGVSEIVASARYSVADGQFELLLNLPGARDPLLCLAACLIAAFVVEMRRYEAPGTSIVHVALVMFSLIYVGLLLACMLRLRFLGSNTFGMFSLLAMIAVVKTSDIGAYTIGRLVGRHKLAPVLSPGKTWEGAFGALAGGCLAAYLMFEHAWPAISSSDGGGKPEHWISFGLIVSIAGMVGDLAESLIKRDMGSKDSSPWLPGFGGMLDIIDSPLVAAPVAYFVLEILGPQIARGL